METNEKVIAGKGLYITDISMKKVISIIDEHFGEGYAAKHPELLGKFLIATSINNTIGVISDFLSEIECKITPNH